MTPDLQHFSFLTDLERRGLFAIPPQPVVRDAPAEQLALSLGATLYSPGTRPGLAADARRVATVGTTSHVWCLEDAIPHDAVERALANVISQLGALEPHGGPLPLLFVRVRTPEQIRQIGEGGTADRLTGFVLPKFSAHRESEEWFDALRVASEHAGRKLYALPVLEHSDLAWIETRRTHLLGVRALLDAHRGQVLSVRVGGTDLCGLFGLRRDRETTIWDVAVVREMLSDVLNVFARGGDYAVSGPVWEHFSGSDRLLRPHLRQTPFFEEPYRGLRAELLDADLDELLREVLLDRSNGFLGKTVIHPSHVSVVNALQAVTQEEYDDAVTVSSASEAGGVRASSARNKMNELGPHTLWARQLLARAAVYGVVAEPRGIVALIEAGWRAAGRAFPSSPLSNL